MFNSEVKITRHDRNYTQKLTVELLKINDNTQVCATENESRDRGPGPITTATQLQRHLIKLATPDIWPIFTQQLLNACWNIF